MKNFFKTLLAVALMATLVCSFCLAGCNPVNNSKTQPEQSISSPEESEPEGSVPAEDSSTSTEDSASTDSSTQQGEQSSAGQEAEEPFIVIAWYAKTSTSGLTDELVAAFVAELKTYLAESGATQEQLNAVVVRAYAQDLISEVGEAVNGAGDVDIIFGVGKNLKTQGNIDFIEREIDQTMGTKTGRVIARLSENLSAKVAYDWMVANVANIAGETYVSGSVDPYAQQEEPQTSDSGAQSGEESGNQSAQESGAQSGEEQEQTTAYLVIAWWNYSTSGLNETLVNAFVAELKTYLATKGATSDELATIVVRAYSDSGVADVGAKVNADADVDVILGMGGNITSKALIECAEKTENTLVMGTKTGRLIARLSENLVAKVAYDWMVANVANIAGETYVSGNVDPYANNG